MAFKHREVLIEHRNHTIRFDATLDMKTSETVSSLSIDDAVLDTVRTTPKDGVFGCKKTLEGALQDGQIVRVNIFAHFFRRPFYQFWVGDLCIHEQKGTWGGL